MLALPAEIGTSLLSLYHGGDQAKGMRFIDGDWEGQMAALDDSDGDSPLFSCRGDDGGKAAGVFASEDSLEPRVLTMAARRYGLEGDLDFLEEK